MPEQHRVRSTANASSSASGKPGYPPDGQSGSAAQPATPVSGRSGTLVIACGALAHELTALKQASHWQHLEIRCLPAEWHNTPGKITPGVERLIHTHRQAFASIVVAYGDCGTGGELDRLLQREQVERLPGAHCYAFFAGLPVFEQLAEEEIGTFYLTDYLARNFSRLVLEDLGINQHPQLRAMYFGHYRRLVYLAQTDNPARLADAQHAADALELPLVIHRTGLQPLQRAMYRLHPMPVQPATAKQLTDYQATDLPHG